MNTKLSILLAAAGAGALAAPLFAQATLAHAAADAGGGDEVVVTATRSGDAIPADLVGSSVTVISDQDLRDRQTRILSDVLRDVPGVSVSRTGAPGDLTDVRIRGSEADHVLVFVDGIKADDPFQGAFDFGTLLTDEAARVEVLRGQQSSLYGSDAIGGVVSYTTLSGRELPGVSLRAEGGSFGTVDGGARVAGVAGDLDYALSSSVYHADGYPIAPGGARDIHSTLVGVSGKANWTPAPNLRLSAVGRYGWTRAGTDDQQLTDASPVVDGRPVIATVDTPGDYTTNRGLYGLVGAQWDLAGGRWTNAASATVADTRRRGYDGGALTSGDHGRRWRGSLDSTLRFGDDRVKHRVTLAVDAERQDFRNGSPGTNGDAHRIDTLGVVAQYDLTVDDRFALTGSARHDVNSRFRDDTTFRATGSYLFAEGTRVHAAYGTGVRDPEANDLFGYYSGEYVGNPDLKPERSRGWEAGVEQELANKRVRFGATFFDNRFLDGIDTTYTLVGGDYVQTPYNNAARFRQLGVETYASARVGAFRADLAYTFLHAPQTIMALAGPAPADGSTASPVPVTAQAVRRARDIASANLTWAPQALPVSVTATARYNGRQNDSAYDADFNRTLVGLRPFTLVDLGATWDVTKRVQLFGRIENLLDRRYQEVFTYATPGRAAYGGVRLKL